MINVNIQMLRGVSVLLVLLFHLDIGFFKFGYIGVDVFFLISGFLMPIIIPKYSAWGFIVARFKRLVPALSLVVLSTLILGYFFQLPGEYLNLSVSSLSSFAFLSQFYFIFNTGYFDQDSIYQPLLHTWSLGNEFLAYILVFFALLITQKNKIKNIALLITVLSACYIFYALNFTEINYLDPIPRLFLFFSAFYVSCNKGSINLTDNRLLAVAITSLFAMVFFFGQEILQKSWPNYAMFLLPSSILPLMLMNSEITPFVTFNKMLHKLGDWSYSIYIWHWPVIAFERIYLRNANINNKEAILLFVVSIIIGCVSYSFIERKKVMGNIALISSLILSVFAFVTNGASYRIPESLNNYSSVELMTEGDYFSSKELINNIEVYNITGFVRDNKTMIIGDSHSRHILPIYEAGYKGEIYRISLQPKMVTAGWNEIESILDKLEINTVIFAYRLHKKNISDIDSFIEKINGVDFNRKYKVEIIRDIPSFDGDPIACLFSNESDLMFKGCGFDIKNGIPIDKVLNHINPVWTYVLDNTNSKVRLLDTHKRLCNSTRCMTMVGSEFILRDSNHFNEKMSKPSNEKLYNLIFQ